LACNQRLGGSDVLVGFRQPSLLAPFRRNLCHGLIMARAKIPVHYAGATCQVVFGLAGLSSTSRVLWSLTMAAQEAIETAQKSMEETRRVLDRLPGKPLNQA